MSTAKKITKITLKIDGASADVEIGLDEAGITDLLKMMSQSDGTKDHYSKAVEAAAPSVASPAAPPKPAVDVAAAAASSKVATIEGKPVYIRRVKDNRSEIKKGEIVTLSNTNGEFKVVNSDYLQVLFVGNPFHSRDSTGVEFKEDQLFSTAALEILKDTDRLVKYLIEKKLIDEVESEITPARLPRELVSMIKKTSPDTASAASAPGLTAKKSALKTTPGGSATPGGFHGGALEQSIITRYTTLDNEINKLRTANTALLASPSASNIALYRRNLQTIMNYDKEMKNIINDISKKFFSTRSRPDLRETFKIDQNILMINEAIDNINLGKPYMFKNIDMSDHLEVSDYDGLRNYILEHMNDPIQLLLALSSDKQRISLEALYSRSKIQIQTSPYTLNRNKDGIWEVTFEGKSTDMPELMKHRKQFTEKSLEPNNKCYGFGPKDAQASEFCVELLLKCLTNNEGSLNSCKELFQREDWEYLLTKGIENTNIYMIERFLLNIGYPRKNKLFHPHIDEWYSSIERKYKTTPEELTKIKNNHHLEKAILGMVEKYNTIMPLVYKKESETGKSRLLHLRAAYGPSAQIIGGELLNFNHYGGSSSVLNFNKQHSPSTSIHKLLEEILKDVEITKSYKEFFVKMQNKIELHGKEISQEVKNQFQESLDLFEKSEKKLNKLLQMIHNFAWFLGSPINDANLSEEQKALNKKAEDLLKEGDLMSEKNITAYNEAREKLINSMKKRTNHIIGMMSPYSIVLGGI